jgi:hypothetical protein
MSNNRSYVGTVHYFMLYTCLLVINSLAAGLESLKWYDGMIHTEPWPLLTTNSLLEKHHLRTQSTCPVPTGSQNKCEVELSTNVIFNGLTSFTSLFKTTYLPFACKVPFTLFCCFLVCHKMVLLNYKNNNFIFWVNYII